MTGTSLFVLPCETQGLALLTYPTVDDRRAADLKFAGVMLPADALLGKAGESPASLEQMLDEGAAAVCAEALGVMARLLSDTFSFPLLRRPFVSSIPSFPFIPHTRNRL